MMTMRMWREGWREGRGDRKKAVLADAYDELVSVSPHAISLSSQDKEGERERGREAAPEATPCTSVGKAVDVNASLLHGGRRGGEEVALGQAGHEGEEEAAIYYAAASA